MKASQNLQNPETHNASNPPVSCSVLSAETFSIRRNAPGYYSIAKNGIQGRIFQYESGSWRGWWMVDWQDGVYHDPVATLREAKQQARNRQF